MSRLPTIAIVGGGFAGAMTATQILRSGAPARVVVIDRDGARGHGVAYSTGSPAHLLNVPAGRMSAFADEPDHFLDWARARLGRSTGADAFLPRSLYGEYLAEVFAKARASATPGAIRLLRGAAIDVEDGLRARITMADGRIIAADRVVIARGHSLPRHPPVRVGAELYGSRRYRRSPWTEGAFDGVEPEHDVLLIGAGLTMYDVALALRQCGHRGTIHALSRRGLLPRCHAPLPLAVGNAPALKSWLEAPPTALELLRAVRAACDSTAEPRDWRAVVDSIRPMTGELWQRLPAREQNRLVARLRPFWEVHRHRAAPAVHRAIGDLIERGILRRHTGEVRSWQADADGVSADLGDRRLRIDHVFNCTGPDTDVLRSDDPLVGSLVARGLIVRDRLGLGVETADDGALIDARGRASSWLFTLGTWRKPRLWESVAVPELRAQAASLARRLAAATQPPRSIANPAVAAPAEVA